MTGLEIGSKTLELEPGDTLVLYTDGVTEAFNEAGTMFEESGLLECLNGAGSLSADGAVSIVAESVRRHAADFPQSDDLTVVAVRRTR